MRKLQNGKAAGKDEVTGEMIKGGGDRVMDWIWELCYLDSESGVMPEDWRSAMTVPLYKGKRKKAGCSNYRGIGLLSVVVKIYSGILVAVVVVVVVVTEGLIDDEQGVLDLHPKADR